MFLEDQGWKKTGIGHIVKVNYVFQLKSVTGKKQIVRAKNSRIMIAMSTRDIVTCSCISVHMECGEGAGEHPGTWNNLFEYCECSSFLITFTLT